jgi:hypothetical protein
LHDFKRLGTVANHTGGAGADSYVFSDTNGSDDITFVDGDDDLDFTEITAAGKLRKTAIDIDGTNNSFTFDDANTTVNIFDTDATDMDDGDNSETPIADFADLGQVGAFLNAGVTTSNEEDEEHYFIINDGDNAGDAFVYKFTDDGDDTALDADGSELSLIGTIDSDAVITAFDVTH